MNIKHFYIMPAYNFFHIKIRRAYRGMYYALHNLDKVSILANIYLCIRTNLLLTVPYHYEIYYMMVIVQEYPVFYSP
jgi:hypothetical protein